MTNFIIYMRKICVMLFLLSGLVSKMTAQVLGEPFIVWDFADGIPSDWQSGINSTTDLAHWEYRGPSTVPDHTVGARGTCSGVAVPIPSQTQSNGFVIFDGNYWDDSGTACGGAIGSGIDPGPHTTWLITPAVDLTSLTGAVLTFQQQYRSYQATTRVDISTDEGNNWTTILENPYGAQSASAVWASVDISSYIVDQPNVRFRFYYSGFYYWWILDDITIYEPNDNDLMMSTVRYTNHNEFNFEDPYIDLEYDQYPIPYIPDFNFGAAATNVGYNPQTNTYLNVRIIQDGLTETYNQNTATALVNPGEVQNLLMPTSYQNPATIGDYTVYFTTEQDQEDETPWNNIDSLDYSITSHTFARDEGPMETSYGAQGVYIGYRMEAGTFYQAFASSQSCHSLQVGLAEGTALNSGIYGIIYNEAMDDTIAFTDTVLVNAAFLNGVGDENLFTLPFPEPVELMQDSVYFVAVSQADSTQTFVIARSGNALAESALIRFPSINATFISPKIPMVRMNIFPSNALTGCTDDSAINFDPTATTEDGSCLYSGCSDEAADNYDPQANYDDDSCVIGGCFDPLAANYNPEADYNNGSCLYPGCTDSTAVNYDPQFNLENGTCQYLSTHLEVATLSGCYPYTIHVSNLNDFVENSNCSFTLNSDVINEICSTDFEYTIETPGTYELTYTFMVNNAVADTTISIVVFDHPQIPVLNYDATGYQVNCINCSTGHYEWYHEGEETGTVDGPQNIFFNDYYQNGLYSILVTDENGCQTGSEEILVIQPFFMTNVTEACTPLTVTANNLSDFYAGTDYIIDFGDGSGSASFNGPANHTYTTASEFDIVVTATNGAVSGSYSIPVQVNPVILPVLVHNSADDVVECSNCNLFEDIVWNIDGVTETGPGPFPDTGNSYGIIAITPDGCSGSGIIVLTGLSEGQDINMSIYPVPANDQIYINISEAGMWKISIIDVLGQIISESQLAGGEVVHQIDTGTYSDGWYSLVISNGQRQTSHAIQILHE